MVLRQPLLHAKIVKRLLGDKWEILSGSNAHGDDGVRLRRRRDNAKIIARSPTAPCGCSTRRRPWSCIRSTSNPDFCYVVGLDLTASRLGDDGSKGACRCTPRLEARPSAPDADHRKRRRRRQKKGWYYEILRSEPRR